MQHRSAGPTKQALAPQTGGPAGTKPNAAADGTPVGAPVRHPLPDHPRQPSLLSSLPLLSLSLARQASPVLLRARLRHLLRVAPHSLVQDRQRRGSRVSEGRVGPGRTDLPKLTQLARPRAQK